MACSVVAQLPSCGPFSPRRVGGRGVGGGRPPAAPPATPGGRSHIPACPCGLLLATLRSRLLCAGEATMVTLRDPWRRRRGTAARRGGGGGREEAGSMAAIVRVTEPSGGGGALCWRPRGGGRGKGGARGRLCSGCGSAAPRRALRPLLSVGPGDAVALGSAALRRRLSTPRCCCSFFLFLLTSSILPSFPPPRTCGAESGHCLEPGDGWLPNSQGMGGREGERRPRLCSGAPSLHGTAEIALGT